MAGLAKGLAVLEAFGSERPTLTIAQAAKATGVTRAAARRCLLTLAELGYVRHDGIQFRPTPRLVRLGLSYLDSDSLPQLAQGHLTAARDVLGESVSLAVLDDGWSLFAARAESQHIVLTGVRVGARLPAYCSATGRVLLSGLPDAELDPYLARCDIVPRTPVTVTDRDELRAIIVGIRQCGYAVTDEELELGMRSLAVPVVDVKGRTQAALSTSAYSARVSLQSMIDGFTPTLKAHAEEIGRML